MKNLLLSVSAQILSGAVGHYSDLDMMDKKIVERSIKLAKMLIEECNATQELKSIDLLQRENENLRKELQSWMDAHQEAISELHKMNQSNQKKGKRK